jgi:hypothetical protein
MKVATAAILLTLAGAVGVHAKDRTYHLRMKLNPRCGAVGAVALILNGHEEQPAAIALVGPLEWQGKWDVAQFDAKGSCAGAHLGGRRTDCQKSEAIKPADDPEALFELDCADNPAREVTIETIPPTHFAYLRHLESRGARPCDCDDHGDVFHGLGAAVDVRLPYEKMQLQVDADSPVKEILWMTLDDPIFTHPMPGAKSVSLDRKGICDAIIRSSRREQGAGNAYDTNLLNKELKVEHLILTVK